MVDASDAVLYEVSDGVALITLNRPERMNAWSPQVHTGYFTSLDRADADPEVKVIVVTGAGRAFCAGADVDNLVSGDDNSGNDDAPAESWHHTHALSIRKPVIAAINGGCAGLGFVHAMACDLRFAAGGAKITSAFSRRGLVAEYGISWMLPRIVGQSTALDILLSGRVFLAEEAKEMGVVDRVFPPDLLLSETLAYARDIAENASPTSMATIKSQVLDHPHLALDEALADTERLMETASRDDISEGVTAFVERRPPNFAPLKSRVDPS